MNTKKVKLIRKLSRDLGLNYDLQKSVFERLSTKEQEQYIRDARIHVNDARNDRIEKSYGQST